MTSNRAIGSGCPPFQTGSRRISLHRVGVAAIALVLSLAWLAPASAQEPTGTPVPSPEPDAPRIELEFEELNDSGVSGTAILSEYGDQTIVELELEGTGENHPAHIHEGTCEDISPQPAYNLENVREDGISRTLVDAPLQELIDGDYVIDLHRAPNELGTLIVCADIEGTPEAPGTGGQDGAATPDSTGDPTAEPAATESPTVEPTEEGAGGMVETPTPEPTKEPTPEPTAEPTQEPTPSPTPEPTEAEDGAGGMVETPTPAMTPVGDGTDGGKGIPLDEAGKGSSLSVGGASSSGGDGTTGSVDTTSGKGEAVGGTSELPATTGSGSSLFFPSDPSRALPTAAAVASLLLLAAGLVTRRGHGTRYR